MMIRNRGFTLLELIVAMAVTTILLTLGLPPFTATLQQNCVVSGANAMLVVLTRARDEAVTRNASVSICKSSDGLQCAHGSAASWTQGFVTFADPDRDGILAPTEKVLAVNAPFLPCASLSSSYANFVSFNSEGVANSNGNFFVKANAAPAVNRKVVIFIGRVRICNPQTDSNCRLP
ncbi:MAG: Tfp pilus assembly protein FimT [Nevskia sp.]|nr:Tfp pilus assembly protein FimT [Nevskia sp.]